MIIASLVTAHVAEAEPLVAVMVADPEATGVTNPVLETAATEELLLLHVMAEEVGLTVAVSWYGVPPINKVALVALSDTVVVVGVEEVGD